MDTATFAKKVILFFNAFNGWTAYGAIFGVLLLCGFGLPIPEDITLISAGILAAQGKISFAGAMIAGFVGVLLGDAILFTIGRKYGRRAFGFPVIRKVLTPKRIVLAEEKVRKNSRFICFIARFIPGLRAPIYLTAGVLGVKPINFYMLDGFAALISVPVWVWAGHYFGQNIEEAIEFAKEAHIYIIIGIVLLIVGYIIKIRREKKLYNEVMEEKDRHVSTES